MEKINEVKRKEILSFLIEEVRGTKAYKWLYLYDLYKDPEYLYAAYYFLRSHGRFDLLQYVDELIVLHGEEPFLYLYLYEETYLTILKEFKDFYERISKALKEWLSKGDEAWGNVMSNIQLSFGVQWRERDTGSPTLFSFYGVKKLPNSQVLLLLDIDIDNETISLYAAETYPEAEVKDGVVSFKGAKKEINEENLFLLVKKRWNNGVRRRT